MPPPPQDGPAAAPLTRSVPAAPSGVFSTRGELIASGTAGVCLLAGFLVPALSPLVWVSLALGMVYGARAALASLLRGRLDIDVLMVVGAGLAAWTGHPAEGALLLFLFVLAGALEDLAAQRTSREIEALHAIMPRRALVLRGGAWAPVDPAELAAGERIKVRPGERVPADARVELGSSLMDQAALTGESVPREVDIGDEILAGTINTQDALEASVLRPAAASGLQRVLELVTRARAQREPIQRAIDRLNQPYALGVMAASLLVAVVWALLLGRPWSQALYTAVTLLIVASPCALVIATPTATLAAIARGARAGVLFKGGVAIERLARVGAACMDKTGTLTRGRPRVTGVTAQGIDQGDALSLAAGLEADSTHPIAAAIREAALARGLPPRVLSDLRHTTGHGLRGVADGREARLGRPDFAGELLADPARRALESRVESAQAKGEIAVALTLGDAHAVLTLADPPRAGARNIVAGLHALGVSPVLMLTGDGPVTARVVAAQLGVDGHHARMLPEGKVRAIQELKGSGKRVLFVGDGVNDAPAMAASDAGLAIGQIGSEAAVESADAVLMGEDLAALPWAIGLCRRARATIRTNLTIALGVMGVMSIATLVASLMGRPLPMALGVVAHEGGTLLVVLSSLRLLGVRRWGASPAEDAPARTAAARGGAAAVPSTAEPFS